MAQETKQTMIFAGNTLQEAKVVALEYSQKHPSQYVTLFNVFGLYLTVSPRLHVFAPSDAIGGHYWINGKEKPFTTKQRIADQIATPHIS